MNTAINPILQRYFSFIKNFLPDKSVTSAVGLDMGAGECKLVELNKSGENYELCNWAIEPLVNDDVADGIKKCVSHLKQPCKSLYSSVFGKGTLIRYVDLPRIPLNDLKNSFALEADKYFPFAADQIYTDCYILDPKGKEKQMAVMAAAAKKEIIDERIKLLSKLELPTDFIGINPIALANVFHVLGDQDSKETSSVALLDMGESVSSLTIFVDRVPRFTRDIFVGGRDLTKRISNALGVEFKEAERLKREPGQKREEILRAYEMALMNIIQEIKLSFDYFTTERNREISKFLLTGGASMLDGISELFQKNLEVNVGTWDPLDRLKLDPNIKQAEVKKVSMKLGVAIGLALYHYD